jgi:hypothetical protein
MPLSLLVEPPEDEDPVIVIFSMSGLASPASPGVPLDGDPPQATETMQPQAESVIRTKGLCIGRLQVEDVGRGAPPRTTRYAIPAPWKGTRLVWL